MESNAAGETLKHAGLFGNDERSGLAASEAETADAERNKPEAREDNLQHVKLRNSRDEPRLKESGTRRVGPKRPRLLANKAVLRQVKSRTGGENTEPNHARPNNTAMDLNRA